MAGYDMYPTTSPAVPTTSPAVPTTSPAVPTTVAVDRWSGANQAERAGRRPISVMIVDGQAVFRSGLARLLGEDERLDVVATSEGGHEVAQMCLTLGVDVLITDVQLQKIDGMELIRQVGATSPDTRILIVSSAADWGVIPAMAAGASGFLLKDAVPEAIMSAVVAVHLGEQVLCRDATNWVIGQAPVSRLTRREMDVLQMVGQGAGNREIAERLHLREKTVRNYVSRLYRKLAVHNRSQIANYAHRAEAVDASLSSCAG
jgi:DNA-binding NarL/FixJ family response regulator